MNASRERQLALESMLTHLRDDDELRQALWTGGDVLCALLDRAFGPTTVLNAAAAIIVELATLAYDAFVDIDEVRRRQ